MLGVLGALLVPFIHLSVYLFRTLHPMPIVLAGAPIAAEQHAGNVRDGLRLVLAPVRGAASSTV